MASLIRSHLGPSSTRYVCQLKKLTFQYCKRGGSSKGLREYINKHVVPLAEKHDDVTFYVRHRPFQHPRIVAEFLHGNSKIVSIKNITPDAIAWYVHLLCSSSGSKTEKLQKMWHTNNPSIQGNWTPFLHK